MAVTIIKRKAGKPTSKRPATPLLESKKELGELITKQLQLLEDGKSNKDKTVSYLTGLAKFDAGDSSIRLRHEWRLLINYVKSL
jgi:hypothetical protein